MPRNQSTAAKRARTAGGKYTAALREQQDLGGPPRLIPITSTWCEPGCDGSPHPGASCRSWDPINFGQATVPGAFDTCQAADLPRGRVRSLDYRFLREDQYTRVLRSEWWLGLIYAMVLDEQPELTPDPVALRAACEANDIATVDILMGPLDRAAVQIVGAPDTDRWHEVERPRVETFVERTLSEDGPHARYVRGEIETWDITVRERLHDATQLAERWHKAFEKKRNWDGYMACEGVIWHEPQKALDMVLLTHTAGHAIGTDVEVDGQQVHVRAAIWGSAGPPVAYWVLPAKQRHRSMFDWVRIDADRFPPTTKPRTSAENAPAE